MTNYTKIKALFPILLCLMVFTYFSCDSGKPKKPKPRNNKTPDPVVTKVEPKGVNFYVENSGSMFGYFEGGTEFKDCLLDLASRLQKDVEYYYINTEPHPLGNTYEAFVSSMDKEVAAKTGKTSNSELAQIIKMVSEEVSNTGKLGFLTSDFIFNITGKDPKSDLSKQKFIIKEYVEKLKAKDYGVLVMKFNSQFNGKYYDYNNKATKYNGPRPFYVWVIGHQSVLATFMEDHNADNLKGFEEFAVFYDTQGAKTPYHSILLKTKAVGSMTRPSGSKDQITTVENAEANGKKVFEFSLAIDLSGLPVNDSYLSSMFNYEIESNGKNTFSIAGLETLKTSDVHANDQRYVQSATHIIRIKTSKIIQDEQKVTLRLRKSDPQWISGSSSEDDRDVATQEGQTFGLKYLVEGVSEAFDQPGTTPSYFSLDLTIKR